MEALGALVQEAPQLGKVEVLHAVPEVASARWALSTVMFVGVWQNCIKHDGGHGRELALEA